MFTGKVQANVSITNVGKVPGKEVVELYIGAPKGRLSKPAIELKAFAKTNLLQPGQTQTLSFTITDADLASFYSASSAWIAEPGTYRVAVGASSLSLMKSAKLDVAKEITVAKVHRLLSPQREIDELKAR